MHTGSRQLGERICRFWQRFRVEFVRTVAEAKFEIELQKIKDTHHTKAKRKKIPGLIKEAKERLGLHLPSKSKELDHVEDVAMHGYLTDMLFAQEYASVNRKIIVNRICSAFRWVWNQPHDIIETVHNYVDFEDFIIRKGAIASYEGQPMIIPFNMEDGILVCKGKSNPEWNYSAPHGAGRVFSRSKAKAQFGSKKSMEGIADRMSDKGVYSSAIPADEVKEAYKDPKVIEEAIEPTAEVVNRIKPILNLKDGKVK